MVKDGGASMLQKQYVMAIAGGLVLILVSTSCASKSRQRTAANPSDDRPAVTSDRMASSNDSRMAEGRMAAVDQKAEQGRLATEPSNQRPLTERPVPSNRTGSGDPMATNQAVPCADERADMTAPLNCVPREHTSYSQEALSACAHRTDADGHIIFQDQACAKRYRTQMGSSFENVDYSRESAYFDRYMDKAVKHAREAEIAANQGHSAEMLRHAELALDQAKEAQRAGNVPGLREGISELRQTLRHGQTTNWADAGDHVRLARMNLAQAAGMKPNDLRLTGGNFATRTGSTSMAGQRARTVRGELIGDEAVSRADGNRQYLLRDQEGKETRILLTPDMNQRVQAGDKVQAELDPEGRVVAINKE
jgi:hypothetical protein